MRGPQSALWGSEAIGGVVAVEGVGPDAAPQVMAEAGSFGFRRAAGRGNLGSGDRFLSFGVAAQGARGIDAFDGTGDRDGYRNLGGLLSAAWRLSPSVRVGGSGFMLSGRSEYDGYSPFTYLHADTLDESRNRLRAGRLFAEAGDRERFYVVASASLLGSSNRNFLDDSPVNRTSATRRTAGLEGGVVIDRHRLVLALDAEGERFRASDEAYFGATDQRRRRSRGSATLEWKSDFNVLRADLAIRHDRFDRFKDATTLRGSVVAPLAEGIEAAATYGEGIAQPSFFDLYGFFPGSFVGNPSLRPERSRGGELSLRYRSKAASMALTAYRQRLSNEIVGTYDPGTFLSSTANADGRSRRRGIEAEWRYRPLEWLSLGGSYAWLDASEPDVSTGQVREQRRPGTAVVCSWMADADGSASGRPSRPLGSGSIPTLTSSPQSD
ncbi:TonB-dependent receptor [Sphingomonas rhizophila]|uniref:TonB-dependent receptor n=1 Tax=Sphingomonas rhizophila TaxID=2071607 RepID=A0A7G9SDH6_9SPHN|nr:TonB-dependent receptor [Sphingomonas rhizophila]